MPANSHLLNLGEALWSGQSITSANGRFTLEYQADGNLVLYKNFWNAPRAWIWDSETHGTPAHVCSFQTDGNLVLYTPGGEAVWDSGTWVAPRGNRVVVQDDGCLVINRIDGVPIWRRGYSHGGFAPMGPQATGDNMTYGQALYRGQKLHSQNGSFTLHFREDGNLVLNKNLVAGPVRLWQSGTSSPTAEVLMFRAADRTLAMYREDGQVIWTQPLHGASRLIVCNDGNLAAVRADETTITWETQTNPHPVPNYPTACSTDRLNPGQLLRPGEWIRSPNGVYTLYYQPADGHLVLYRNNRDTPWTAFWGSGTAGHEAGVCALNLDGTFVVYDREGRVGFSTRTAAGGVTRLQLQDDGNLVLYAGAEQAVWASNTARPPVPPYGPTATGARMLRGEIIYPGRRLATGDWIYSLEISRTLGLVLYRLTGIDKRALWSLPELRDQLADQLMLRPDGNLVVYRSDGAVLWTSNTAGQGGVRLVLHASGNLALEREDGSVAWQTGTGLPSGPAAQGNLLAPGQTLAPGASIHSTDARYTLTYQADGNLVLYKNFVASPRAAVWASGTSHRPGVVHLGTDGNLAVYDFLAAVRWQTGTGAVAVEGLRVQDDGNLVLYGGGGVLWASGTVQPEFAGTLVERWAPEVRLHPDDAYRPASVDWYLPRVRLEYDGDTLLDVGEVNPQSMTSQSWALQKSAAGYPTDFYLHMPHDSTRAGHLASAKCYAHEIVLPDGGRDLQYWFFYPYNGDLTTEAEVVVSLLVGALLPVLQPALAVAAVASRIEHEADWEHVTVRLNAQGEMTRMYLSAHDGEGGWFEADQIQRNEHGRPIVWSALDSHASYRMVGSHHRAWYADIFVPDETADGGPKWNTWERLELLRPEQPEKQPWLRFSGLWGQMGELSMTNGPRGPMFQASWHGDREEDGPDPQKGWMQFRSEDDGGGELVGRTTDAAGQVIRILDRFGWTNDQARSLELLGVRAGTIVTVYNDSDGAADPGRSRIEVKRDLTGRVLVTDFQEAKENEDFKLTVLNGGELNGKVSRVTVQRVDDPYLPSYPGGGGGTGGDPDRPPVQQNSMPTDPTEPEDLESTQPTEEEVLAEV